MNYSYEGGSAFGSILYVVLSVAVVVLSIIAYWKIFEKAGEAGWKSIIPFYNVYTLFKITWGSGWKFLLLLIPIANIVFMILTYVKLGQAFKKSGGFIVGLIFLTIIFEMILAFDKSEYIGAQA